LKVSWLSLAITCFACEKRVKNMRANVIHMWNWNNHMCYYPSESHEINMWLTCDITTCDWHVVLSNFTRDSHVVSNMFFFVWFTCDIDATATTLLPMWFTCGIITRGVSNSHVVFS
jgi:hypothetical protein